MNCYVHLLLLAALRPDRFPKTSSSCSTTPIVGAAAGEKTRLRHETTWRRNLSDEEQHDDYGQGSDHRARVLMIIVRAPIAGMMARGREILSPF